MDNIKPIYSNKWVRKFMRQAREVAESTNCGSRNVGCLFVKNKIPIMQGMNGPPQGCSNNCDRLKLDYPSQREDPNTRNFISERVEPWYNHDDCNIYCPIGLKERKVDTLENKADFLTQHPITYSLLTDWAKGKNVCPRKILGCKSGENLNICSCAHSEANAVAFAARYGIATEGASVFLYQISPCSTCASMLVGAGIKEIYSLYRYEHKLSEIILQEAKVNLFLVNSELLDVPAKDGRLETDTFITYFK